MREMKGRVGTDRNVDSTDILPTLRHISVKLKNDKMITYILKGNLLFTIVKNYIYPW